MTFPIPHQRLTEDQFINEIIELAARRYEEALKKLGRFNLGIFGKTGAGKSTLLNAVFGEDVAPAGLGSPVTTSLTYYPKPERALGIYDSRGFETGESTESLMAELTQIVKETRRKPLADQIHAVWYVVRWADRRIEQGQIDLIKHIDSLRLPVVFVLTQVPVKNNQLHPDAVAFAEKIKALDLPIKPNRVLYTNAKADAFEGYPVHGLKDLLEATFQVSPEAVHAALTAAQQIDLERKRKNALLIVNSMSATAALIGASPIPFSDAALLIPTQVGMIAQITAKYGLTIPSARLGTLVASVVMSGGATGVGRYVVSNLLKMVPGVGTVAGAVISGSTAALLTGAMGRAWMRVCEQVLASGVTEMDNFDMLKRLFQSEVEKNVSAPQTAG